MMTIIETSSLTVDSTESALVFGISRQAKTHLQKGPTVLGAQASSPARVPPNQQPLTELVALDAGRRGRLRSQDRGAFSQGPLKHIGHCGCNLWTTHGARRWIVHEPSTCLTYKIRS